MSGGSDTRPPGSASPAAVLGTPTPAGRVTGALIDREERKGKGAGDHAPVVVELAD